MDYSLRDRVLFALLALPDKEARKIVGLLDEVASAPLARPVVAFRDAQGRTGYVCAIRGFRVYFYMARNGRLTFTDLRHHRPES